ncbi:MAG: hypothetical protein BWY80_00737 [Firmicutes bacterium ADurb.Bin456]|nr:MAG: hypothetical protein BWY80_00737 [Firmicutes bacterium ADurb.Bin456]
MVSPFLPVFGVCFIRTPRGQLFNWGSVSPAEILPWCKGVGGCRQLNLQATRNQQLKRTQLTQAFKIVKIFCKSYFKGCEREGKVTPGFLAAWLFLERETRGCKVSCPVYVLVALEPPRRKLK